jgi:hypothetical protein
MSQGKNIPKKHEGILLKTLKTLFMFLNLTYISTRIIIPTKTRSKPVKIFPKIISIV